MFTPTHLIVILKKRDHGGSYSNASPPFPQFVLPNGLKASAEGLQSTGTLGVTASACPRGCRPDLRGRERARMFVQPSNDLAGCKRGKAAPGRVHIEITRRGEHADQL